MEQVGGRETRGRERGERQRRRSRERGEGEKWMREREGEQKGGREKGIKCSTCPLLFIQSRDVVHGMALPPFRVVLPASVSLI